MWGHIERFGQCEHRCGGCVRIFEDDHEWGDPYVYSFPFHEVEPGWIELYGIVGRAPTTEEARAVMLACKRAGLRITRERKAGARQGHREITRNFKGHACCTDVPVRPVLPGLRSAGELFNTPGETIMLTELTIEMKSAAAAAPFPVNATGSEVWGFSLREILQQVLDKALVLGREHRDEIEQAAKSAVDALVAFDLPGIPAIVENFIDEATRTLGYQAIEKVLDAILAEQVIG